jgi:SAM-dependent methyltransferase
VADRLAPSHPAGPCIPAARRTAESAVLVCPQCGGSLAAAGGAFQCAGCGSAYPCEDGIPLFAPGLARTASYDPVHLRTLAAMERHHFWHVARTETIAALLEQLSPGRRLSGIRVVEIGCGNGAVARALEQRGASVVAGDVHIEGLRFCRGRSSMPLYQLSALRTPFAANQFQAVGAFDLLEHLDDDLAALREMHRICAPGGVVLVTVPALPKLWSYFDVASGHKRRYKRAELVRKLTASGLSPIHISSFMTLLLPVIWGFRMLRQRLRGRTGAGLPEGIETRPIPLVNAFLLLILRLERPLVLSRGLPLGASLIVAARKPA